LAACSIASGAPSPEFLKTYCINCHGAEKQKGDVRFDSLTADIKTPDDALLWQDILDQLNQGDMPPKKEKQPQKPELLAAVDAITQSIADATQRFKATGAHTVLRRLNSFEYRNTIADLLGLNVAGWDPSADFPPEVRANGFDNNSASQMTSGILLDHYFVAAEEAIKRATAFGAKPEVKTYTQKSPFYFEKRKAKDLPKIFQTDRYRWVSDKGYDDLVARYYRGGHIGFEPLGHGGAPQSGRYTIRVQAAAIDRENPYPFLTDIRSGDPITLELAAVTRGGSVESTGNVTTQRTLALVEVTSDKPQWFDWTVDLERGEEPEVRFRNGTVKAKALAFKLGKNVKGHPELEAIGKLSKGELALAMLKAYRGPKLRIWEMQVAGPQLDQWPTPGHALLYGKLTPDQISRANIPERLKVFAEAAFRRPLAQGELSPIGKLINAKLDAGMKPLDTLQLGFQTILCSPAFLHLHEGTGKLNDYALASRLSYFFWSSMPDQTLIQLASAGKLHEPSMLSAQVDRMLADPKSQRFGQNFIRLWLNLDHIGEMPVSADFVSFFRDNIDAAMRAETEMFFRHILDNNLPPRELLSANYSFLNRELALHYGLPPIEGVQLRQVTLPKGERGGLLTQASFLTASANGVDTSPVVRGVYVQQKLLGYTPPPPPPSVPLIEPDASGAKTIREQLAMHRENATCASCHQKIDPFGFALENFNAIGGWRTNYSKDHKIDASGDLPTGEKFKDVTDFRTLLIAKHEQFTRALTEKLMTYALGREESLTDRAVIDGIVKGMRTQGRGLRDLIHSIVASTAFQEN
jgi:mono/diheme cytochrome c family protein